MKGFVCTSSVERIERVVRSLVDAGLAETEISIVYPRRSRPAVRRGEFSGSLSRKQGPPPELEGLLRGGHVLVCLASEEEVDEEVLLVVRCKDDSSRLRVSSVFAAAGGVWDEDDGTEAGATSGNRRDEDA